MTNIVKSINPSTVINDPNKLAAIYMRKSGRSDNYSEDTQYRECMQRLLCENLLLYNAFFEVTSAIEKPIYKRKQFNNLIQAAKKGYFKTIIVSRLDRLIRRVDDLNQIIDFLQKYKIRLIIADIPTNLDINNPVCRLNLNLLGLSAYSSGKNIGERTLNGKIASRENGLYNPGRKLPLGYTNSNTPKVYVINDIECIIVKYIYFLATDSIDYSNNISTSNIRKNIVNLLEIIIENFTTKKLKELLNTFPNATKLIYPLITLMENSSHIDDYLIKLKDCLSRISKKSSYDVIESVLTNSVYAGLLYLSPNKSDKNSRFAKKSVISSKESSIGYELNLDNFFNTTNIPGFIDLASFEKTYCFFYAKKYGEINNNIPFLLENKLRCSCGKKLVQLTPGILECTNNCKKYYKTTILKLIINNIITDILSSEITEFDKFIDDIDNSLNHTNRTITHINNKKNDLLLNFINNPTTENERAIYNIQEKIDTLSNIRGSHLEVHSFLINIKNLILNKANNSSKFHEISDFITHHILINEHNYIPIFDSFIKEVKLTNVSDYSAIKANIKYKFKSVKTGYIYPSLNRKTR